MKRFSQILIIAFFSVSMISQSCKQAESGDSHFAICGDTITADGAVGVNTLPQLLAGLDSIPCKLEGEITAVCQTKGCWMTMPIGEDEKLFIKFKDYDFFVPMNASGRNATIDGIAFVDSVSVADLKHRAKDAGKTEEEIEAIQHGEVEYSFLARGVLIK